MTPQNPAGALIEIEAHKAAYLMGWASPAALMEADHVVLRGVPTK